eukprot:CAMPEP_0172698284 /NCGR_PEP_ID=MMETSP1074-20121228/29369_1 /TAXON_ID=2916 /ORGANISM="Ceratium fusus, Strain PA161109" /LENGTH=105 /DNA_ID=CAMNT_0013519303 /DNA_START=545 /DNA_END=861 /DNA_ORIENTATION=-
MFGKVNNPPKLCPSNVQHAGPPIEVCAPANGCGVDISIDLLLALDDRGMLILTGYRDVAAAETAAAADALQVSFPEHLPVYLKIVYVLPWCHFRQVHLGGFCGRP